MTGHPCLSSILANPPQFCRQINEVYLFFYFIFVEIYASSHLCFYFIRVQFYDCQVMITADVLLNISYCVAVLLQREFSSYFLIYEVLAFCSVLAMVSSIVVCQSLSIATQFARNRYPMSCPCSVC